MYEGNDLLRPERQSVPSALPSGTAYVVQKSNDSQTPHQVMRAGLVRVFDLFVSARWPATDTYFITVSPPPD